MMEAASTDGLTSTMFTSWKEKKMFLILYKAGKMVGKMNVSSIKPNKVCLAEKLTTNFAELRDKI